jgi:hypothetical protein
LVLVALQATADARAPLFEAVDIALLLNSDPAQVRARSLLGQGPAQQDRSGPVTIDALDPDGATVYIYEVTHALETEVLGHLRLSYNTSGKSGRQSVDVPVMADPYPNTEARFAIALTGFGLLLGDPDALGEWGYDDVIGLASSNLGPDLSGQRAEAVMLMQQVRDLSR